jgi:hypothetical protein
MGSVKSVLKNKEFSSEKVNEWLSTIFEEILRQFANLGPRFKYCATAVITQDCGAGLLMASTARSEKNADSFFLF